MLCLCDVLLCHPQFQRSVGEKEEHVDLWIGYCAFHLGDYKRAMEVILRKHVCVNMTLYSWVYRIEQFTKNPKYNIC